MYAYLRAARDPASSITHVLNAAAPKACIDMCEDMCIDTHARRRACGPGAPQPVDQCCTHVDVLVSGLRHRRPPDMCIDMRVHMDVDLCIYMCADMCIDMCAGRVRRPGIPVARASTGVYICIDTDVSMCIGMRNTPSVS